MKTRNIAQGGAQPRAGKLRDRLLSSGEKLIGDHGVEGVSMRQISLEAGTHNNYAVQYHFGDLDGLVLAIVAARCGELEARRDEALVEVQDGGQAATRPLLDAFFRPLIELLAGDGQPRFARFMLSLHRNADGWKPLDEMLSLMPVSQRIFLQLHQANPAIPEPVIWQRLRPVSVMVLTYTCSRAVADLPAAVRSDVIDSLIDMAAAAIAVPVRRSVVSRFYGTVL